MYAFLLHARALVLIVLLATLGSASQAAAQGTPAGAAREFHVGAIFPLTGPLALLGNETMDGVRIAVDMFNESGGLNGAQVVLHVADAPDATAAANEANRLITRENVQVIIGSYSSALAMAGSQVAERNRVVWIETSAGTDDLTRRRFRYLFRVHDAASDIAQSAARFVAEYLPAKLATAPSDLRVAVLHEDGAYGTSVGQRVNEFLREYGIQPVYYGSYNANTTDLSSTILRLKNLDTDVVVLASYINDAVLFMTQSRQLDFVPKAIVGQGAGHALPDFAALLGSDANGVFVAEMPNGTIVEALNEQARAVNEEFRRRWMETHPVAPSGHAYRGFETTWLFLEHVLRTTGTTNAEQVREAMLQIDLPLGAMPSGIGAKFLPPGDANAGHNSRAAIIIYQWQNGEFLGVWPDAFRQAEPIHVPLPAWQER